MNLKLVILLLPIVLIWTDLRALQTELTSSKKVRHFSLRADSPNLRYISLEDFQRNKTDQSVSKIILLDETEQYSSVENNLYAINKTSSKEKKEKNEKKQDSKPSGSSGNLNLSGSGSPDLDKLGLILVVVIGVVVVGMILVGGGKILYEAIVRGEDFPELLDISLELSFFERNRNIKDEENEA